MGVGEVDRFENGADKDESLGTRKAFHGKKGSITPGSVPIKAGERAQCVLTGFSGCQGTQEGRELQPGKAKIDKGERCSCRGLMVDPFQPGVFPTDTLEQKECKDISDKPQQ